MNLFDAANILLDKSWTFAKTMPKNPHRYTLRKNWDDATPFKNVVQFVRNHGRKEVF